ncbi:MAG: hypothetical protein NC350_03350, partial [Corallococcus sp.]|nr:hypothetical protein [Corallococcus sp.]
QDFIDEYYLEYISDFKAEILSANDELAVQSIQRHIYDYNIRIESIDNVLRWLNDDDFLCAGALNKAFLSNIEKIQELSKKEEDEKYKNFIQLLSNVEDERVLDSIQIFLNTTPPADWEIFLGRIIPSRPTVCRELLDKDLLGQQKKELLMAFYIRFADSYDQNGNSTICNYISLSENYMKIFDRVSNNNKVIHFIEAVQPLIKQLDDYFIAGEIQQYIIQTNRYELNIENLEKVLNLNRESQGHFYSKNYETIMSSNKDCIISYISNNLDLYVKNILLSDKVTCQDESIENMKFLINNDTQIMIQNRANLVQKCCGQFENIMDFKIDIWEALIKNNKISATWKNIFSIYESKGFEFIKDFLIKNKPCGNLEGYNLKNDSLDRFVNDILVSLTSQDMQSFIVTMPITIYLSGLNLQKYSDENIATCIEFGKVQYEDTVFDKLYILPQSLKQYLTVFEKEVMDKFNEFFSSALPARTVSRSPYNYTTTTKLTAKSNAQEKIASVIACPNINVSLKSKLITECVEIIDIAGFEKIYADYILNDKQIVPSKILWQFTNAIGDITEDMRKRMLYQCIDVVDAEKELSQYKAYLSTLGASWKDALAGKKTVVEHSAINEALLKVLKSQRLIEYAKARNKDEYVIKKIL